MSYARLGPESDVYVLGLEPDGNTLTCMGCSLDEAGFKGTAIEMFAHLRRHQAAGHKVPRHTLERLVREMTSGKEPTKP